MRALRFHGRLDVRLEDVPEPTAGPGEVLLDVAYNGLCGSDVHEYYDGPFTTQHTPHPLTGASIPIILGHELSGTVAAIGEGVDDLDIGARVAVEPLETCGSCARCLAGWRHTCRRLAIHGYTRQGGGLSDRSVVRRDMVHVLPDRVSLRHGALVEPMAVAWRAARRSGARRDDAVAVHGAGPIGLGVVLALRRMGIDVIVSDPSPLRRFAATSLGASLTVDPLVDDVADVVRSRTGRLGAAASIDTAGAPAAVRAALDSTRPDGTIVIVAHHGRPLEIPTWSLLGTELRVVGTMMYDAQDFPSVITGMSEGHYPINGWVATIPLERAVSDGLEALHAQQANKVLVSLAGGDTNDVDA